MDQSNALLRIFNIIFPFSDFLFILQKEEYSTKRLIRWIPKFFFRRNIQNREKLVLTKRVKITLSITLFIWLSATIFLSIYKSIYIIPIQCLLIPIYVLLGNLILTPWFETIKRRIEKKARERIAGMPNLKIITVAGSYGKTTTKNFIYQLIKESFKTQMIPGNINTPIGIAVWINENINTSTEILITEVDAYKIGEIKRSCLIIPSDIAIITNIGDQHLERLGNVKNLAKALSETFQYSKPNAKLISTKEVFDKISIYQGDRKNIEIRTNNRIKLSQSYLSESNKINLNFALVVANELAIPIRFINSAIKTLELPENRQRLSTLLGFEVLDDSYNISFSTAIAGINEAKKLALSKSKKLLVITAGIPELSKKNRGKNEELGKYLAANADTIIILKSMFWKEVARGANSNCSIFPSLKDFLLNNINEYDPKEWFILLQPELHDLYY